MTIDADLAELVMAVVENHPIPWRQREGYGDRGGHFVSIEDAKGNKVFDGEFGQLSDPVFDLLLNFPELAGQILGRV